MLKKQKYYLIFQKKIKLNFCIVFSIDDANLHLKVSNDIVKIPSMESRNKN